MAEALATAAATASIDAAFLERLDAAEKQLEAAKAGYESAKTDLKLALERVSNAAEYNNKTMKLLQMGLVEAEKARQEISLSACELVTDEARNELSVATTRAFETAMQFHAAVLQRKETAEAELNTAAATAETAKTVFDESGKTLELAYQTLEAVFNSI